MKSRLWNLILPLFIICFFKVALFPLGVYASLGSSHEILSLKQVNTKKVILASELKSRGTNHFEIAQPSEHSRLLIEWDLPDSRDWPLSLMANGEIEIHSDTPLVLNSHTEITASHIQINAPQVDIQGNLKAPGGMISINSDDKLFFAGVSDVAGRQGGSILFNGQVVFISGLINADGEDQAGTIEISAKNILQAGQVSADSLKGPAGNIDFHFSHRYIDQLNSTVTASTTLGNSGGRIRLKGGDSGRLYSSGVHRVTGLGNESQGGEIQFLGEELILQGSRLDASGQSGGGRIRIGGDLQGKESLLQARKTSVSYASVLMADAREKGPGGDVVIWSTETTEFNGQVTADSPAKDGTVEISSKGQLKPGGSVSTGSLLLDPKNIDVNNTDATFPNITLTDPNPNGTDFGFSFHPLFGGDFVVTDPSDNIVASKSGAVYVFSQNGFLKQIITGAQANDEVGSGDITILTNGKYVVNSPKWDNGATVDVGAATLVNVSSGSLTVGATNSLIGSTANDEVGTTSVSLGNGSYVVISPNWDNGGTSDVGAVTFVDGTNGLIGAVSTSNSLHGSTANDQVGFLGATVLTNGNYVVRSNQWDNSGTADVGAVTFGNGSTGVSGAVDSSNSLIGSTANDQVGFPGVVALTNGNYVVRSNLWDDGGTADVGAVTFGNGSTGVNGAVDSSNSLIGSTANDGVGNSGLTALSNGNYVVISSFWDNGGAVDAGAVTLCDGSTGTFGAVDTSNSLHGSSSSDLIGFSGVVEVSNGDFFVQSPRWTNAGTFLAGAVTQVDGSTGLTGPVTTGNSLHGSSTNDQIGFTGTALSNGNYILQSPFWDDGGTADVGAVTWIDASTGRTGPVTKANSLHGTTASDGVGTNTVALGNGNFVVGSPGWDDGGTADVGAATWVDGSTGLTGPVTTSNSLHGTTASDGVGDDFLALSTPGSYVVIVDTWDNGGTADVGAVTFSNVSTGISGPVTTNNSLHGSTANDKIGTKAFNLGNGNYVVLSPDWDNGGTADAGAATLCNGTNGTVGPVSNANSIIGESASTSLSTGFIDEDLIISDAAFFTYFPDENTGTVRISCSTSNPLSYSCLQTSSQTISPAFVTDILNTGTDVTLQASNDLTITSAITANNGSGDGGALTLQAGRSVLINNTITTDNGALTITGNDLLANGVEDDDRMAGDATITMSNGISLNTGTGAINIEMRPGTGLTNNGCGGINLESVSGGAITVDHQCNDSGININNTMSGSTFTFDSDNDITFSASGDINSTGPVTFRCDSDNNSDAGSGGACTMANGTDINSSGSNITFSSDESITLGNLTTSSSDNLGINLTSVSGSILDAGTTEENINVPNGGFKATTGIDLGASGNPLEGTVGSFSFDDVSGSVFFTRAGTTVSYDTSSSDGGESTATVNLPVSLNQTNGTCSVDYSVSGGTATGGGADYTLASGTLTFPAGTLTKNIAITITDDSDDENDQTIEVTLSNPVNVSLGTNTVHTYTILDNDLPPVGNFDNSSSNDLESVSPKLIQVSLTGTSEISSLGIDFSVTSGTATGGGTDFTLAAGTLTFNPSISTQNISIDVTDDAVDEDNETIVITLTGASIGTNTTHTYTIVDNDGVPTVSFDDPESSDSETNGNAIIPVSLSNSFGSTVTVEYSVTGGSASGGGVDFSLASGTLVFDSGITTQNITIPVTIDAFIESNETIELTLSNPSNAGLGIFPEHTFTINDGGAPVIVINQGKQVISPYWQADSETYTFIGVSHPSLSQMNSQIGVNLQAFTNSNIALDIPLVFTIQPNETIKVFIVQSNHPFITPQNLPGSLFLLAGSTTSEHGQLKFSPIATQPFDLVGLEGTSGRGYADITMLNYWGAVVVQATSTGFAMEFIGDMKDSRARGTPLFSGVN